MSRQMVSYQAYARFIKRLVIISGLWPGPVSWSLYRLVPVVLVIAALTVSAACLYFVISHISNIEVATRGLSVAFSMLACTQKVIVLTMNRDYLFELHGILDETFQRDLSNVELRPKLLSTVSFFHRGTIFQALSVYLLMPLYVIVPPISIVTQLIRGSSPLKYHLPFPTQYPWATDESLAVYATHYVLELIAGFAVVSITSASDALFGFYVFQMTRQFRTLSHRMANLRATGDYRTVVMECATRHQILTHCRDRLEETFGPIILWMLMTSAVIICALIYQFSHMTLGNMLVSIVYIIMKLLQTLLYGWYGMALTTETEIFRDSVYNSDWPGTGEKSLMTSVLIMIQCKPLILTACKFSPIGLDMFVGIVNTAVSYFFLLQTLEEQ